MSHREAFDTWERHRPYYESHGHDIIVYSPVDSVCPPSGHLGILYGNRGHHSPEANRRFKRLISFLATTVYDRFVVHEYDSLCLTPTVPRFFEWDHSGQTIGGGPAKDWDRPFLCANVFRDNRPDRGFVGTTFCHPPLIFTRVGLHIINTHLQQLADDCESGFWDRMLGLACENAGIEPMDFMKHGLGFARNTVEVSDLADAHDAAAAGAIMFHGIKSELALRAIKDGHEFAKRNGKLREGLEIAI